jgi:hypothetical protein
VQDEVHLNTEYMEQPRSRNAILVIRKILKWIGIMLGSLVGLLVLAFITLYIIGTVKWNRLHGKYDVPVETITIPTDQASIARGKHIATIRMCGHCHMDNLSGQTARVPGLVTLSVPNLTSGVGGVGPTTQTWIGCAPSATAWGMTLEGSC